MKNSKPKPFVFVLMPFDKNFNDIYQLGIKQACDDAGAYCERVDEQIFHESILDRIYNQIAKADLVISDMTGRNPNVFYETGYAHALGKKVILLTHNSEDIPFDLMHYPHLIYKGSITDLKDKLKKKIAWHIDNTDALATDLTFDLQLYIYNKQIVVNQTNEVEYPGGSDFYMSLFNASHKIIGGSDFKIGVLYKKKQAAGGMIISQSNTFLQLPSEQWIEYLPGVDFLYPEGWGKTDNAKFGDAKEITDIRIFTPTGVHNFPIKVIIKKI